MDRFRFTTIAHAGRSILNPIGSAKLDAAVERLDLKAGERVLDVGCGKAEALARLIERFGVTGAGVDPNPAFLSEAAARVPPGAIDLRSGEIAEQDFAAHSFDAALCIGSSHAFGGYLRALVALRGLVRPGGSVLMGEGYWKRRPDPEYLAVLGGGEEDLFDHEGNALAAREAGYEVIWTVIADERDWDEYEGSYADAVEAFVREHPEDPNTAEMTARIGRWREAYWLWGRETLGFGLYLLRSSESLSLLYPASSASP